MAKHASYDESAYLAQKVAELLAMIKKAGSQPDRKTVVASLTEAKTRLNELGVTCHA